MIHVAAPDGKQSKIDIFSTAYGCPRGGSGTNKLFEGSLTAPPCLGEALRRGAITFSIDFPDTYTNVENPEYIKFL